MKKMLEKISRKLCTSFCDNENIAYTERLLPDGKRQFHFINMSTGSDERQSFTINVKSGDEIISRSMDIGTVEIKELVI